MSDHKLDLPEDLNPAKPSDGSWTSKRHPDGSTYAGHDEEKGLLHLDELKGQAASENTIPLSPQWLHPKSSETRIGFSAASGETRAATALPQRTSDFVQKDRWRQDGSQEKKDWRRPSPDLEGSHRWREEERETGLLGRRERRKDGERETDFRKNDRRVDNAPGGETADTRNLPASERKHEVGSRNSGSESRRDSKWSSRWGPDDKLDPRTEKKPDADKEDSHHEKQSFVGTARPPAESDSRDKWRPRHREVQPAGSTVYRAAPGFGLARGQVDGSHVGFTLGRGRSRAGGSSAMLSSSGPIGCVSENSSEGMLGKSGVHSPRFRYPRGKLLDIYRNYENAPSFSVMPNPLMETPQLATSSTSMPLAFVIPDSEEESILDDIWKGKIISSESSLSSNKERAVITNDGANKSRMTPTLEADGTSDSISSLAFKSNINPQHESLGQADKFTKAIPGIGQIEPSVGEVMVSDAVDVIPTGKPTTQNVESEHVKSKTLIGVGQLDPSRNKYSGGSQQASLGDIGGELSGTLESNFDPFFQSMAPTNDQYPNISDIKSLGHGTPSEDLSLYYCDPQGDIQGPFLVADIMSWLAQGFFGIDLPVCLEDASPGTPFQPLGDMMSHLKLNARSEDMVNVNVAESEPCNINTENMGMPLSADFAKTDMDSKKWESVEPLALSAGPELSKLSKSGDAVNRPFDDLLLPSFEGSSANHYSDKQNLRDLNSPDAEEVLYSGRHVGFPRNTDVIGDLARTPSGPHLQSGDFVQSTLPSQKVASDNSLHPLGLLWSELEGAHKRPLSSNVSNTADQGSVLHHALGRERDTPVANRQHDMLMESPSMHGSWSNNHRAVHRDALDIHQLSRLEHESAPFNFEEQLLAQQLQRQHAQQRNLLNSQQAMLSGDSFLEQLQSVQQPHSFNRNVSDLEERLMQFQLQQQRQIQIQQQQQQLKQKQQQQQLHNHQIHLLQQQQQQSQAQQLLFEQLLQQQLQDSNFGPGVNVHDQLLMRQKMQELQLSRQSPRPYDPAIEQLIRAKFGHSLPPEHNHDVLELLAHVKHRQMQTLEHQQFGLQQEQLLARQFSGSSRQFPVMEEDRPAGLWSVDESGQFVRSTGGGPLRSRSSGLNQFDILQQHHRQQSFERQSHIDQEFPLHDRIHGAYEPKPQFFDRPVPLASSAPGSNVELLNSFSRVKGLDMQEQQFGHLHPSAQIGRVPSGVLSHNHQMLDQLSASNFVTLEGRWPDSNGQLASSFAESRTNQHRLDVERQNRDLNMNAAHDNPNAWMAPTADDNQKQILMDMLQKRNRLHSSQSIDLVGSPPITSYEMRDSSRHFPGPTLDDQYDYRVDQTGPIHPFSGAPRASDIGRMMPEQLSIGMDIVGKGLESNDVLVFRSSSGELAEEEQFFPSVNQTRSASAPGPASDASLMDPVSLLEKGKKLNSSGRLTLEGGIDQPRGSMGAYNFNVSPANGYIDDLRKERATTLPPQSSENSSLKREGSHALSAQEAMLELSSGSVLKGKNTNSPSSEGTDITRQGRNVQPPEISNAPKKDMKFRRASSSSDNEATETSFVDMLKSTKKPTPEADSSSGALEPSESSQGGKSAKKKGKKGRQIDPSLLGFKVHSNRIMMGEIQRLDD